MSKLEDTYLEAAKYILHYINHIIDHGIFYHKDGSYTTIRYIDVNWRSYLKTQKLMVAYVFIME
uniref:Uncharacterized protein n=2 Tax=Physcomitrium patens TaxID=3218 RepID=A0A2K1IQH8_PHYPA|nr:hypothetical protein PHYPA_025655 [Physcomitrium patens]